MFTPQRMNICLLEDNKKLIKKLERWVKIKKLFAILLEDYITINLKNT